MKLTQPDLDDVTERLKMLVSCCRNKTGQSYKVRGLLYSLWNGKPYSLLELLSLDYQLRENFLLVCLSFGASNFFYDQIKAEFVAVGLFDWFCEEGDK